ncbi:hypothetical protein ARUE_c12590 [Arthrobacter sp. Rue61a]|nr:hypothetical protein ARUE_c12590 [Arthrobacter sp. Rue61a]
MWFWALVAHSGFTSVGIHRRLLAAGSLVCIRAYRPALQRHAVPPRLRPD